MLGLLAQAAWDAPPEEDLPTLYLALGAAGVLTGAALFATHGWLTRARGSIPDGD